LPSAATAAALQVFIYYCFLINRPKKQLGLKIHIELKHNSIKIGKKKSKNRKEVTV
jgi:hypothetical protein